MNFTRNYPVGLITVSAFTLLANSAYALDGNKFLETLNNSMAAQGFLLETSGVEVADNDLTLRNIKLRLREEEQPLLELGDLVLEDVQPKEDRGYTIGRIQIPDIDVEIDGERIVANGSLFENCKLAADPRGLTLDSLTFCETMKSGPVSVTKDGQKIASFESAKLVSKPEADNTALHFEGSMDGIQFLLEAVDSESARDAGESFFPKQLNGSVKTRGTWEVESGRAVFDENSVELADIGRLNLSFAISGYTLQAMYALQDATIAAETNHADDAQKQLDALTAAMFDMAQKLTLQSASLRFDDGGITQNIFAEVAKEQNIDVKTLVSGFKVLSAAKLAELTPLLGPDLTRVLTTATHNFLDEPESITVSAAPPDTITFGAIADTAMSAPQTLPQALALEVKAND